MRNRNLWQLFTETAATYPQDLALIAADKTLTYQQLQHEVYFYIDFLKKQGVSQSDRVAVLLPRDSRLLVTLLAVLGCGATYVPLDFRYPRQRHETILADSNCKFIITQESNYNVMMVLPPQGSKLESVPIQTKLNYKDLAYIIYTSGSTGVPKGVMVDHGNVCSLIDWAHSVYSREELSFTLAATSICFDLSIFEIFVPLTAGGCVVLIEHVLSLINNETKYPITLINTVPSAIEVLVKAKAIPDSVETINLAGEALQQSLVNGLYGGSQVKRVYNLYGPTETTTYSTYYLAEKNYDRVMVPIGKAISGTQIFLLDSHHQPVPKLVRGEIYIAGEGVTQGYCNSVEGNQAHFIELEMNGKKVKLYCTGDLARINHSLLLEYLGRKDQQIKIRGFRVEPDEIAHALKQHTEIKQAYVMTHPEIEGGQQLLAYVVAREQNELDKNSLSSWLLQRLPDYMVPHYFLQLSALPVNINGKIDRAQLPLPRSHEAPSCEANTEIETSLAVLWQSLLGNNKFKCNDNFFYVGGHSLLAARLQAKIQETFGIEFKLEEIFEYPSITEQANLIKRYMPLDSMQKKFELLPRPNEIPVSFSQQRLWYLQYAEDATPISNIPITINIEGDLNVTALTKAFKYIIERHEILRTTYHSIHFHVVQVIHDYFDFAIETIHCTADELPTLLSIEANKKFDLSKDLMVRVKLFKVADGKQILLVTQHHIVSDAWSLNILMRELSVLYRAYRRGLPLPIWPVPTQYADYSCWQRFYLNDKALRMDLEFWRKKLEQAPQTIKLPYDKSRSELQTYRGEFYQWELPADLVAQLKNIAQHNQSTLFMVLLTAFNTLLYRYTQQKDFCIGILSANRPFTELEHTLGFFVNTLVARNQVDSSISSRTLLRQVRQTVLECLAHQQLPFDKLVEALRPNHQANRHPYFQVLFSLQNSLECDLELDDLILDAREYDRKIAKFDLTLSLVEKPHGLSAIFEFNSDLFYRETIVRMKEHYVQILKAMIVNLDTSVGEVDLLTKDERQKCLVEMNNVNYDYPNQATLSELFAESVSNYPEKTALIIDDNAYSYAELDLKSTQLANLLKEQGVDHESNVGLLLPRSLEVIISMLAVVKAGACYVPLDPVSPTERLDYILQDAKVNWVISMNEYLHHLPASLNLQLILLDSMTDKLIHQSAWISQTKATATSSCYIMYTSGSTGKPKGVIAEHQGVVRLVKNTNYVRLDEKQVLLQVSQLVFDGATFDIWGSLLNAGTLVMMPDGLPELNKLTDLIVKHGVTTLFVTTQLFNTLVDYKLPLLSPLKQLLFGGDVASIHHVEKFKIAHPHCAISNIYGPTECTTYALSYLIPKDFDRQRSLPLGTPISNTCVVILSDDMQVVPVNVPGEIYLGGPGLARGYLNQYELTREKFIRNPISELSSEYLYRTGDIGVYRTDGQIAFLGRVDDQIKLRGYRIELPEIEQALRSLSYVIDAVVLVQKPEDLLVAYLIPAPSIVPTLQAVRQMLSMQLPSYMLPDALEIMNEYPLTTNGKIDKVNLPKHQFSRRMKVADATADTTLSKVIYDIWVEVLNDEEVTYEDNFFEIGGNSLKIVHILDRLQAHFVNDTEILSKLDITTLFQYPTITSLAKYLMNDEEVEGENHNRQSVNRRDKRKKASQ